MKQGDIVYIHDNRYGLSKAQIIKHSGSYCTIKLLEHNCAYGTPVHRLLSEEEYKSSLEKVKPKSQLRAPLPH